MDEFGDVQMNGWNDGGLLGIGCGKVIKSVKG